MPLYPRLLRACHQLISFNYSIVALPLFFQIATSIFQRRIYQRVHLRSNQHHIDHDQELIHLKTFLKSKGYVSLFSTLLRWSGNLIQNLSV